MKLQRAAIVVFLALGLILPRARGEDTLKSESSHKPAAMIFKPTIVYPYAARKALQQGSGIAVLEINPKTGEVIGVRMAISTGSPILDQTTIDAFRRARFAVGTSRYVKIPIAFSLASGVRIS